MPANATYPFPGLNTYFEKEWFQVHPAMIVHALVQIQRQLPADLRAVIEQGMTISALPPVDHQSMKPDVSVWRMREDTLLAAAPPNFVPPLTRTITSPKPRHLAIRQSSGELVTAIELLSPSNKHSGGAVSYVQKRMSIMALGVNLVEIDLVRKWGLALLQFEGEEMTESLRQPDGRLPAHSVNVFRAENPQEREIYPISYQQPLPACRVPLRPDDSDVWLDLQKAAEQCHEECAFEKATNYTRDPEPPLSPEDAAWLDGHLKSLKLR
ncbi:MAG: DUF4058 family protein [Prosthecobacter sp.]|uniref:DUF4058 family protein n=1 Tax=Prosthecobacter sp. TaxID=1965333 RepID=UPI001A08D8CC|nr:DUF4058 family protein [Prosthecobacter sp.]MBE2283794.1 DUF4058 family protein [Prosthecobacter sp.]